MSSWKVTTIHEFGGLSANCSVAIKQGQANKKGLRVSSNNPSLIKELCAVVGHAIERRMEAEPVSWKCLLTWLEQLAYFQ